MNIFKKFIATLRLESAILMADNAYRDNNRRFFVMPNGNKGDLIIMDRFNFRKLKSKRYINTSVKVHDLMRECFYFTPNRDNRNPISKAVRAIKREQYYDWVRAVEKAKKARRNR